MGQMSRSERQHEVDRVYLDVPFQEQDEVNPPYKPQLGCPTRVGGVVRCTSTWLVSGLMHLAAGPASSEASRAW